MIKNFIIYGEPYGKINMQPATINGHATLFNPIKNKNYMSLVQDAWFKVSGDFNFGEDQLFLRISAFYSIPKSVSKKKHLKMLNNEIRPSKKPDCDNISKVICDSINKIAFKDDSQIVVLIVNKFYGETPYVSVSIGNIEEL